MKKGLPYCHIWYNNTKIPVVSPVTQYKEFGRGGDFLKPRILGCYPPDSMKHLVPMSVSLVETACPGSKPTNNLRVFYDTQESGQKRGIAVCSKWLSYLDDVSMRIVEWIELLRAQGVDKIFLTVLAVHPNVWKVIILLFLCSIRSPRSGNLCMSVMHNHSLSRALNLQPSSLGLS